MPQAERQANVVWTGDLIHGQGQLTVKSGGFPPIPVTWAARTERSEGKTSPEELLAAAHASCFSMAFSNNLAKRGHAPERLDVTAVCTLDRTDVGLRVTSMALTVRGKVPGIDQATFQQEANAAKDGCPISNALVNNLRITVEATLDA